MFARQQQELARPLLDRDELDHDISDVDDDEEISALASANGKTVTFKDDVQVIPPTLRSTQQSRETGTHKLL